MQQKSKAGSKGSKVKKSNAPKAREKVSKAKPAKAKPVAKIARAEAIKPAVKEIEKARAALKRESIAVAAPAPKARGRKISIEVKPGEATSALSQKWQSLYKKAEQIEAKPYNMRSVFEEKTAILHKVLGWGYILANRNDRLEVLFQDGIKYLISNYKS